MKEVRIIRDEIHPPIAADLLPTVQLFVGKPCGFSPKHAPNYHSDHLLCYFNIFAHCMKRKRGQRPLVFQARHPDIRDVSVGTILSSYQPVRVEHVSAAFNSPTDPLLILF